MYSRVYYSQFHPMDQADYRACMPVLQDLKIAVPVLPQLLPLNQRALRSYAKLDLLQGNA